MTRRAWLAVAAAAALPGQGIRLRAYPQKFRTFHGLRDATVPAALAEGARRVVTPDGAGWTAARRGLVRIDPAAAPRDRRQYFAGLRYLPDDEVLALAPDGGQGVWVRTRTGVSHLEFRPMTLAAKADWFEERIRLRHDRYGMVADSVLSRPGDLTTSRPWPNDNDGLWTAIYAAAECFRFAVTRSPKALSRARRAIEAILELEKVTGIPGLPARSYVRAGEERPGDGVWHLSRDGNTEWKGDTSSDEIVGHFFAFGAAWDHLPASDPLRPRIQATSARMMNRILDHGLTLPDITGYPTYWGHWSPDYFATRRGRPDAPLNALELLAFLKTAHRITGSPRYAAEYRRVAWDLGYAEWTTRLLEFREEINYSDEQLAMLSFYLLLPWEPEERLRLAYRRALEAWWNNMRRECNPLWSFIYATARPDAEVDIESAVWVLYRMPCDLVKWTVKNSDRDDIDFEPERGRFGEMQSRTLLPPDERPVMKWNGNPFRVDGGADGLSEDDGAFFLLPYWMGRYHRLLAGE